jgi:16S rRNA (adenine1518-N6/adenine1519-N6)-dimethyltransferase
MDLTDMDTLRALLAKHDFHFSKSLGQNFLIRSWVPERIIEVSGIKKSDGVLEIGPGVGVLTGYLCECASKVAAVELDAKLLPVLAETLAERQNIQIIHQDILKCDLHELVQERFAGLRPVVCANLPYQVTTPVLTKLLESGSFASLTVMIQKEVAQRICAKPGTPEYGAFSVFAQYHADTEICFDVPPDCFQPRPKVTSSVIRMLPKSKPEDLKDEKLFFSLVRASFAQRRKTLVNGLSPLLSPRLDKAQIQESLQACGFDPLVRGETLGIPEYVKLANYFSEIL